MAGNYPSVPQIQLWFSSTAVAFGCERIVTFHFKALMSLRIFRVLEIASDEYMKDVFGLIRSVNCCMALDTKSIPAYVNVNAYGV